METVDCALLIVSGFILSNFMRLFYKFSLLHDYLPKCLSIRPRTGP